MKITYLGQAGLLLEKQGLTVMVDPYFSDSVGATNPQKHRRQPVDPRVWDIKPDVMIFTHNHLDHYDPETVQHFITKNTALTVLCPDSVWSEVRKIGGDNNFVVFNRHTSWTEQGVCFTAVKAVHSDPDAIGIIVDDGQRKYYITGDTLYNEEIFADIPADIFALFLPVNGAGNNMNMADAARFAAKIDAEKTIPYHVGMFDALTAENFSCENKIIPKIYKKIEL